MALPCLRLWIQVNQGNGKEFSIWWPLIVYKWKELTVVAFCRNGLILMFYFFLFLVSLKMVWLIMSSFHALQMSWKMIYLFHLAASVSQWDFDSFLLWNCHVTLHMAQCYWEFTSNDQVRIHTISICLQWYNMPDQLENL